MENLFIYGTLEYPSVEKKVIGRIVETAPDAVRGYEKTEIRIDNETWPLIVPNASRRVEGELIQVTSEELVKIDAYEGGAYKRERIALESGLSAWVYLKN